MCYILFSSNWVKIARRIHQLNLVEEEEDPDTESDDSDDPDAQNNNHDKKEYDMREEEAYAVLASSKSRAARAAVRRHTQLFVTPPNVRLGLMLVTKEHLNWALVVQKVKKRSPLYGKVFTGDIVLSVDGYEDPRLILDMMEIAVETERRVLVMTPRCRDDDTPLVRVHNSIRDIPDFEQPQQQAVTAGPAEQNRHHATTTTTTTTTTTIQNPDNQNR